MFVEHSKMNFVVESAAEVGSVPTGMSRVCGNPIIRSSNSIGGPLTKCGSLKFVSATLDFDVRQVRDTVVVKADAASFLPAPNPILPVPNLQLIREGGTITLRTTPNSTVKVSNIRGQRWRLETDANGDVELNQLPRGVYTITVGNSAPIKTIVATGERLGNSRPGLPNLGSRLLIR